MYPVFTFIEDVHEYLTRNRTVTGNIIRKHSKKLNDLGDVSFPIKIKNWSLVITNTDFEQKGIHTIFDYTLPRQALDKQLESLLHESQKWSLKIDEFKVKGDSDVHLYLQRHYVIDLCIKNVLTEDLHYGLKQKCFLKKINIVTTKTVDDDLAKTYLTELRMSITKNVTQNIVDALTVDHFKDDCSINIVFNTNEKQNYVLVCGSVMNESGVKDTKTTAAELYKKRALDMQLMAQHKYGVQVKSSWAEYFQTLGRDSVTIEMLQNRVHKSIKLTLNNLQTTNKGPSFIFYNCARISALLKQFEEKVAQKIYPQIPPIDTVDFTLLNQPEEWELVFVYLLQFPAVIVSCVCDVKSGVINLHNLVSFLANLSSVFSVYYRRVKILTNQKEHLLPVLYARIHLIKAVQQVFHTALKLLNIQPIKQM